MNIEILTTKKKISKAIIKQLEPASAAQIHIFYANSAIDGYYVKGLGKGFAERTGLFQTASGLWVTYHIREWNLDKRDSTRVWGNGNTYRDFETQEQAERFVLINNAVAKRCLKNHLII